MKKWNMSIIQYLTQNKITRVKTFKYTILL